MPGIRDADARDGAGGKYANNLEPITRYTAGWDTSGISGQGEKRGCIPIPPTLVPRPWIRTRSQWIRFLVDCPPFRHRNMQIIAPAPAAAGQPDAETGPRAPSMTGLVQRRTRPATRNEFVATADEKGTSPCFTLLYTRVKRAKT